MAKATSSSSLLTKLQETLTCPVCLEIYKEPKLFPCQHSLCKVCTDKLCKTAGTNVTIVCPRCRRRCAKAEIVTNLTMKQMVDLLEQEKRTDKPTHVCELCEVDGPDYFCTNCHRLLCSRCSRIHVKISDCTGDRSKNIAEIAAVKEKKIEEMLFEINQKIKRIEKGKENLKLLRSYQECTAKITLKSFERSLFYQIHGHYKMEERRILSEIKAREEHLSKPFDEDLQTLAQFRDYLILLHNTDYLTKAAPPTKKVLQNITNFLESCTCEYEDAIMVRIKYFQEKALNTSVARTMVMGYDDQEPLRVARNSEAPDESEEAQLFREFDLDELQEFKEELLISKSFLSLTSSGSDLDLKIDEIKPEDPDDETALKSKLRAYSANTVKLPPLEGKGKIKNASRRSSRDAQSVSELEKGMTVEIQLKHSDDQLDTDHVMRPEPFPVDFSFIKKALFDISAEVDNDQGIRCLRYFDNKLWCLRKNKLEIINITRDNEFFIRNLTGVKFNDGYSLTQTKRGHVFVATHDTGLLVVDKNGNFRSCVAEGDCFDDIIAGDDDMMYALLRDSRGAYIDHFQYQNDSLMRTRIKTHLPLDFGVMTGAFSQGSLFVCLRQTHAVFKVNPQNGRVLEHYGGRGKVTSTDINHKAGFLYHPSLCDSDNRGNLLIADQGNNRLQLLNINTKEWTVVTINMNKLGMPRAAVVLRDQDLQHCITRVKKDLWRSDNKKDYSPLKMRLVVGGFVGSPKFYGLRC